MNMAHKIERANCRGCGKIMDGKPYHLGGIALHPETGERCRVNYYGGYICSEWCDRNVCLDMESSMPGAGRAKSVSSSAAQHIKDNWSE